MITQTIRDYMVQQSAIGNAFLMSGEKFRKTFDATKKRIQNYDDNRLVKYYQKRAHLDYWDALTPEQIQQDINTNYGSEAEFRKQKELDNPYPYTLYWVVPGAPFKVRAYDGLQIKVA